jgi:tetratricopeptide (TPR) repeat protein
MLSNHFIYLSPIYLLSLLLINIKRGEYDSALRAFNKILESHEARYGEVHAFVASTYHNLGIVHSKNAKSQINPWDIDKSNSEALLCFQNAARIARDALGSDHPNVAVSLVRLGFILLSMKQFENALVTFSEALRVRVASLGADHALVSKIQVRRLFQLSSLMQIFHTVSVRMLIYFSFFWPPIAQLDVIINMQNNIGVTCLQMNRYADAGEAFHSALKIQRNVLSRLSVDCRDGSVGKDFLQRAKLELADTLCNIASLNLNWAEAERLARTKESLLLDESTSAFEEALKIRLEGLGLSHPTTQRTKIMLEKARGALAAAKGRPEFQVPKNLAGLPLDPSCAVRGCIDDDDNSLAENSVLTSQVLCSPGQMDVCGIGGLYRYAARKRTNPERPKEENGTAVWMAPHCLVLPYDQREAGTMFSDDVPFKRILGWPEEQEKSAVEDLFTSEGITLPGNESIGSNVAMEEVNIKAPTTKIGGDIDDEESVMITNLALPFDDDEKEPPESNIIASSSTKNESGGKEKKSRRGLMLIRPSIRRNKSTSPSKRKSILRRKSKSIKSSSTEIRDIDGGDNGAGQTASWKQPSKKKVQNMLKNPEDNLTALYAVGASYLGRQEYSEAESLFKSLLEYHREKHGEVHPYVGSAMHNLGIVFLRAERYESALGAFKDAVLVRRMLSSTTDFVDNPDVAISLVKVGITHLLLKQFERALENFIDALSIRRRALGELHPSVGRVYNNIGCVHCELNQLNEACGAFEASLEIQRHALSVNADNASMKFGMSTTLCNLSYLYKSQGRHSESVAALREALELQESVLGTHHPTVINTMDSLADACTRVNEHKEAIRLYNGCLTRHNASAGGSNGGQSSEQRLASAIILFKISRIHLKQNDRDASCRRLEEARFYAKGLDNDVEEKIAAEIQKAERSRRGGGQKD